MHHLVWRCFNIIISKEYFNGEIIAVFNCWRFYCNSICTMQRTLVTDIGVAAFGILSDAAGKYILAKINRATVALSLAYTCPEVFQCATYLI